MLENVVCLNLEVMKHVPDACVCVMNLSVMNMLVFVFQCKTIHHTLFIYWMIHTVHIMENQTLHVLNQALHVLNNVKAQMLKHNASHSTLFKYLMLLTLHNGD